jgi:hypothetical protein
VNLDYEIVRWVEYSICEEALDLFPKSKSNSTTFHSFCERLSESIIRADLSKRETNILGVIMNRANKQYCLTDEEIGIICANFFIDKKWGKYVRAIELMKCVNWKL